MPDPQNVEQLVEALALSGATTVAGAMATDAWQAAKAGFTRLFRHGGAGRQTAVESQLDANASLVVRTADRDRARSAMVPMWEVELAELLTAAPEAADELRELIERLRPMLPDRQQAWVQTNIAREQARIFAALGGNVIVHEAPRSPEPPGRDDAD